MDRFFIYTLSLLSAGYILGLIFSQKTVSALLWLFSKLKKPLKSLKELWNSHSDRIFFVAILIAPSVTFLVFRESLELDELIQLLIVEGTFFSVIYSTIIKDNATKHRNRPIITLEFDFKEPDCHKTIVSTGLAEAGVFEKIPAYYIRFRVKNVGKTTLRNAEVVLEKVKKESAFLSEFVPLTLTWALTEVQFNRGIVQIPQGMFRTVDLFKIMERDKTALACVSLEHAEQESRLPNKVRVNASILSDRYRNLIGGIGICGVSEPNTLSDTLLFGKYGFYLSIDSDSSPPLFAKFSVEYDGEWSDNAETMFSEHLKTELVAYGYNKDEIFD